MKIKYSIQNVLIALVFLVLLFNTIVMAKLIGSVSEKLDEAAELNRPARLSALMITVDDCDDCFDIKRALDGVKKAHVEIEKEEIIGFRDEKAKQLISQYDIKKLPSIIFTGEIKKDARMEKSWAKIAELKADAVVFTDLRAPYFDIAKDEIVGRVTVSYINDDSCSQCSDYRMFVQQLKDNSVVVSAETVYNFTEPEAKKLIKQYGIVRVPALVIDQQLSAYKSVAKDWSKVGNIADDGSYVASRMSGPYRDMPSNAVQGLISVLQLVDKSCEECMPINKLTGIFSRFALKYESEKQVDINSPEGIDLVKKYSIKSVPTIIFDQQINAYPSLKTSWTQVGTVESDGSFVFRKLSIIKDAKYKDLSSGLVVSN